MFALRPATKQDVASVDVLLARAYPRLLKADYAPSMLVMALPLISRAQPDLVSCGTYYLVEEDGILIGAGGWTVAAPGSGAVTGGVGHVRHVVTDDRAVRRGVGRALLQHICAEARWQGLRRLACTATLSGVAFYAALGFTRIRDVRVPLGQGIEFPAVEMERVL